MDRALLLSKQGLGGNEALAVQSSLLLPGMMLIGALSSQGVVSKSFCLISMGLLLPTGKAISWEAWGGAGEAVPVPCSAQAGLFYLFIFLNYSCQLPLT